METFKVVETFVSINGEGKKAGRLAMFIRLKGCNLNCSYCDTTWANKRDARCELLTAPQIVERIKEAGVELVTLTGGEPLLDENVSELIGSILMMPKVEIEIETNGSVPIRYYKERDNRLTMTMDYKLPSSNMEENMCLENMEYLKPWDVVKFVIGSREDLNRAKEIIERFRLCEKAIVYFSPVFGKIEPEEIVEFMKENKQDRCIGGNTMAIDKEAIKEHIRGILVALGDDPNREGLKETPDRVAKMYEEVFEGMNYSNHEIAQMFSKTFEDDLSVKDHKDMVIVKDIDIFSYCEHHMALMYDMKVSVAYLPKDKVLGLSKIARICDMVGKRLQLQERIGSDIAEIIMEVSGSEDVAVYIEGCHSCMSARGIKKHNAKTVTTTLRGAFDTDSTLKWHFMMQAGK